MARGASVVKCSVQRVNRNGTRKQYLSCQTAVLCHVYHKLDTCGHLVSNHPTKTRGFSTVSNNAHMWACWARFSWRSKSSSTKVTLPATEISSKNAKYDGVVLASAVTATSSEAIKLGSPQLDRKAFCLWHAIDYCQSSLVYWCWVVIWPFPNRMTGQVAAPQVLTLCKWPDGKYFQLTRNAAWNLGLKK